MSDESVTVADFIQQVEAVERITIEIKTALPLVTSYRFSRACKEDQTIGWWLEYYVRPHLPKDAEITAFDRAGRLASNQMSLSDCRLQN